MNYHIMSFTEPDKMLQRVAAPFVLLWDDNIRLRSTPSSSQKKPATDISQLSVKKR
ncbi:MAG: hypothetical protein MUE33_11145 [Cytophagaceae bacterium]|jgi:hypothetical protein|nr:hypothetical protein [Cytophagaceae bacterium]